MLKPKLSDIPSSVYRLQLTEDFSFKKATAILPYLKELGVESVYCSPYYDAYSSHGYDVTNPNRLNPALGSEVDYAHFCAQLKKLKMGQIIDVVPNHMGIRGGKNSWWQDVLENGPYSEYASFFDIDWRSEKQELQDKVLLPILGDPYGVALEKQQIELFLDDGNFLLQYNDFPLPIAPHTYPIILEDSQNELSEDPAYEEYQSLMTLYRQFPVSNNERALKKKEGSERLKALMKSSKPIRLFIQNRIALFNGKKRMATSFDYLDKLLQAQFYRLSFWKVAHHEINYRRFFNIHELAAICIENQIVLETYHKWLFQLIEEGKAQGLRVDHPDGLYDPVTYFKKLRERFCLFTVVEKILDRKEQLPSSWQVEGTVGYEYLNLLNGLFVRQDKEKEFTEIYEEFVGEKIDFEDTLYHSKKLFTTFHMVSEVESLASMLDRLSEGNRLYRDFTRHDLTQALQELIAAFPVYRTYIGPEGGVSKRDSRYIAIAIEKAKSRAKWLDSSIFDFLEKLLLLKLKINQDEARGYREFILRFQQLTAPIMAKGLEDTCFYIYNRFISLNDVGGDPTHFGYSVGDFHRFNQEKLAHWPYGFLTSSTHDTKRSEDVRMRLNVLSELSHEWRLQVKKWAFVNSKHKTDRAPIPNDEYFIYQTLVGVWPKHGLKKGEWNAFLLRIWGVVLKSLREARCETSWVTPNLAYEEGVKQFLYAILSQEKGNPFLKHFIPFQKQIDELGSWNSLSALALKIASCGVVDIYQGCEHWNYRLVDPDNRVPVDFEYAKKMIKTVETKGLQNDPKLFVHWKALNFRTAHRALFLQGDYCPLHVHGERKNHLIAFCRKHEDQLLLVAAGRFSGSTIKPFGQSVWGDTEIILPKEWAERSLVDLFTDKKVKINHRGHNQTLAVADLFHSLPFVYLYEA